MSNVQFRSVSLGHSIFGIGHSTFVVDLAGHRPVHRRLAFAARALQQRRLAVELLALVAGGAHGVGLGDRILGAAQSGAHHAGADDDAPVIGRGEAYLQVDAREPHALFVHVEHDMVGGFFDDGIPGAAAEDVRYGIETAGPALGRHRTTKIARGAILRYARARPPRSSPDPAYHVEDRREAGAALRSRADSRRPAPRALP